MQDPQAKKQEFLVKRFIRPFVSNAGVIKAFLAVPRHKFVPDSQQALAYQDHPLPIGEGQTISQPSLVAQMTQALQLKKEDRVLEVGTGSGYQAAILAEVAGQVYTIERKVFLAKRAEKILKELGYKNVRVKVGDGSQGWQEYAPFDAIIVTAGAPKIPAPLVAQLKEGGRIVIPVGESFLQQIKVGVKEKGRLEIKNMQPVVFVPLIGKYGWKKGLRS